MDSRIIRDVPAPRSVRDQVKGARDNALVCDIEGFAVACEPISKGYHSSAGWQGNMDNEQSRRCLITGNEKMVAPSDRFMSELESFTFMGQAWRTEDDVVGAFPNVPAMIAGVPTHMRRRIRVSKTGAPLAVMIDLTSSGGISARDVERRGSAVLALVRLLTNIRPVELWASIALGGGRGYANRILIRIETAPLDLARAAHVLSHPSVSRGLGYTYLRRTFDSNGHWAYNNVNVERKHGAEALSKHIEPGFEVLYIPPVYLTDDSVTEPVKWLRAMLKEYGGDTVESVD